MVLYANGIRFCEARTLDEEEFAQHKNRVSKAYNLFRRQWLVARFTFYTCLLLIVLERTYTVLLNNRIESSGFLVFLFCCLFPPLISSIQELVIPGGKWSRALYVVLYSAFVNSQLFLSGSEYQGLISGSSIGLGILLGWIIGLGRWSDANRYLPIVSAALRDLGDRQVYKFVEQDDAGTELISLEVFPVSHLVFRCNGKLWDKWETAEVLEITEGKAANYLAPWYYAPKHGEAAELHYFQRWMDAEELHELAKHCARFKKEALISIPLSLFLTANAVRFIESLLNWNFDPELSPQAWIVVLILGSLFPLKMLNTWRLLKKDIKEKQIISVWTRNEFGEKDELLEEALSVSGLLWTVNGSPTGWRVSRPQ